MKLLIIRPQPGADATARRFKDAGFTPVVMPLFAIEHLPLQSMSVDGYDAILLTSGNAARAAHAFLRSAAKIPIYAVGSATANALASLSLPVAATGSNGVAELVGVAAEGGHKKLLWLAGEDHSAVPEIADVHIDIVIVYRSAAVETSAQFATNVEQCDAIILHSSRAAAHFADLCDDAGLLRSKITLATFSTAIAESAGDGWAQMIVAASPNDAALMEAIGQHLPTIDCAPSSNAAIEGAT
ncbi:MAG: uroporphyrinogen-III synthase [Sphingorhabdus sp.]